MPVVLVGLLCCGPFFFEAPPSIGEYPERLATKRWGALFNEVAPLDPNLPDVAELGEGARVLAQLVPWMEPEERIPAIDRLLEVNRLGSYSAERANWLHELRELALDPAVIDAAGPYLEWRLKPEAKPPLPVPINLYGAEREEAQQERNAVIGRQVEARLRVMGEGMEAGPAVLRPHWRVQRGAYLFRLGRYGEAASDFEGVMQEHPEHPRAEAAGIMLARCHLEASRHLRRHLKGVAGEEEASEEMTNALERCERVLGDFIARYPDGRFTADAHGWLGAVAHDRGLLGLAVRHQLDRLERQPTREVMRTVLRECDFLFVKLFEGLAGRDGHADDRVDPEEHFDAAAVARHPVVARLFVQHALDPVTQVALPVYEDYTGGRTNIGFLKRRILRPQSFVRRAMVALGEEMLKAPGAGEDPVTLLLLAWTATEAGGHGQAWDLLERIAAEPNDEVLHARAVVLQRLERHPEAVEAFDLLEASFPASTLTEDLVHRRSVSLVKAGRAGEAVVDLIVHFHERFPVDRWDDGWRTRGDLYPEAFVSQWLDTLVQFAPLEQIVASREGLAEKHPAAGMLDLVIRLRSFAERDFAVANLQLGQGRHIPHGEMRRRGAYQMSIALNQGGELWDLRIEPLVRLYERLEEDLPPGGKAEVHLEIARHWMEHRGFITMPLLGLHTYAASEWEKQDVLRRANALHLGFPEEAINRELDRRDEATHALEHALAAAESEDPEVAAPALELANHCLFRRAEFSLYQRARALETDAGSLSKDLYRRLKEKFPESVEARRAVWYSFSPAEGPWMPGDYNPANSHAAMLEALGGSGEESDAGEESEEARAEILAILQAIEEPEEGITLPEMRERIAAGRREMDKWRGKTDPANQGEVIAAVDRMDDLAAAASLEGIGMEDYRNYAAGRMDGLPGAFESLVDFRERLKPLGMEQEPVDDTMGGWRSFLENYPGSPKAEAAALRLTRRVARLFRTRVTVQAYAFPEAPITGGYKRVVVLRDDIKDGTDFVMSMIGEYDARFPDGRYRDDIDLLRAGVMIDRGEPELALGLIQRILETPWQRDLHGVAVLNFGEIAEELGAPGRREGAIRAFRENPEAVETLRKLATGDTYLSRLKPLLPWLEEITGAGD